MFNLIVAVISIALIAAMAAASIYYGGDGFGKSSARAQAATLISQAQQIYGGASLFSIANAGSDVASSAGCAAGTFSECAINRLVDGGYLQAIPSFPADVAIQADGIASVEAAFGAPAGTFSWMNRWTVSDNGDLARIFLSDIARDEVCDEVIVQGGDTRVTWNFTLDAAGFYLTDGDAPMYRCVDIDLGGGNSVTAFGFRL